MFSRLLLFLILTPSLLKADWLPALKPGLVPPSALVLNEQDQPEDLRQILSGAHPVLLLPVFTKCLASCPVTIHALKKALRQKSLHAPFRVVIFDFDAGDTADDLKRFRQQEELPAQWVLVRSGTEVAARRFFDPLDYHFMQAEGGFDHPNETFVFSAQRKWSGLFVGDQFSAPALEVAFQQALAADHPTFGTRLAAAVKQPGSWVLLGAAGFLLGLAVIAVIFVRLWA